jgi:Mannan-binding protein
MAKFTVSIPAGSIWDDADGKVKGPIVAAAHIGKFNGQWRTVVEGKMSVCGCTFKF